MTEKLTLGGVDVSVEHAKELAWTYMNETGNWSYPAYDALPGNCDPEPLPAAGAAARVREEWKEFQQHFLLYPVALGTTAGSATAGKRSTPPSLKVGDLWKPGGRSVLVRADLLDYDHAQIEAPHAS